MASSFFEELKKLLKPKQDLQEDKSKAIEEALKKEKDTVDKLKELEDEYLKSVNEKQMQKVAELFPETLGLEKKQYQPKSDEELRAQAEAELKSSLEENKQKIIADILSRQESLDESANKLKGEKEEGLKQIEELYDNLKKKAQNEALKRGLARSSIIMGQISDYDEKGMKNMAEIEAKYIEAINGINKEISKLEADKEIALGNLDLKYASDLAKRIAELEKEREQTILQYEKYNSEIAEKERKYLLSRDEEIAKYLKGKEAAENELRKERQKYDSELNYDDEKQRNYAERYSIALSYYMTLSPDIAADALEASPNMRYYLGAYYDKLLDTLKKRAVETNRYF
ncbi:MAG: hypothetical protein GX891_03070 [Clostridiales bacterium]|nr:hypothetical protein [Clostridiales bacterium]